MNLFVNQIKWYNDKASQIDKNINIAIVTQEIIIMDSIDRKFAKPGPIRLKPLQKDLMRRVSLSARVIIRAYGYLK